MCTLRCNYCQLFWIGSVILAIEFVPLLAAQIRSQPERINVDNADLDNLYHEDENLPDDADIFPRLGKIAGSEQAQSNCRIAPWGSIVTQFPGRAFVEIDRRQVDRNGESWFHSADQNCWIHDRRIDLL